MGIDGGYLVIVLYFKVYHRVSDELCLIKGKKIKNSLMTVG